MVDFTDVRLAHLGPTDLSRLVGTTRVACSSWMNGHGRPHHLHADRVQKVLDAIGAARNAGLLPVPAHVLRADREAYIKSAIEKVTKPVSAS